MYTSSKGELKNPAEMESKYLVNAFVKSVESTVRGDNEYAHNNVLVLKEELLKRLYPIVEEKGI